MSDFPYHMEDINTWNPQTRPQTHNMIRWKSGKKVDPRILVLLELFGEIYEDRHEFFEKIFHGHHEELFGKIGDALKRKKKERKRGRSMRQSMSMRAIGQRGIDDGIDELKVERFKVRTPNVIVAQPDDGQESQPPKEP